VNILEVSSAFAESRVLSEAGFKAYSTGINLTFRIEVGLGLIALKIIFNPVHAMA